MYLSRHAIAPVESIIKTYGAYRDDTDTYLVTGKQSLFQNSGTRVYNVSIDCADGSRAVSTYPLFPSCVVSALSNEEYAAGGELFNEVARVGHIDEDHARRIGLQLLLGVKSLHDNGVCHRDLSLENTLLHSDGTIRIIDFGQAGMPHKGDLEKCDSIYLHWKKVLGSACALRSEPLFDDRGKEKNLVNAAGKMYYRAPEVCLTGRFQAPETPGVFFLHPSRGR